MQHSRHYPANDFDAMEHEARKRAGRKLGWCIHAAVYLLVNLGLMSVSLHQGKHWAVYPALFWGIGLLAHGASVWLRPARGAFWNRMVQRERDALLREQGNDVSTPH